MEDVLWDLVSGDTGDNHLEYTEEDDDDDDENHTQEEQQVEEKNENGEGSEKKKEAAAEGDADAEDEESNQVAFVEYEPSVSVHPRAKKHPDPVRQNATLACVKSFLHGERVPPNYLRMLRETPTIATEGRLSDLQLEFVAAAVTIHKQRVPVSSGRYERRGFLLADGAGMGKGRQLAGIIYENYLHGRQRSVWVSTSNDLFHDAERDLRAIQGGANSIPLFQLKDVQKDADINAVRGDGVLFCTYSLLSKPQHAGSKRGRGGGGGFRRSRRYSGFSSDSSEEEEEDEEEDYSGAGYLYPRLNQVEQWMNGGGMQGSGCLLFDESHRAKNLVPEVGNAETGGTHTGRAVAALQHNLPEARVVYCSATAASAPRHCMFMTRLGLWGAGAPFTTKSNFMESLKKSGVGMMEMIAHHLKQFGLMLSRTLSFEACSFERLDCEPTEDDRRRYAAAATCWQLMHLQLAKEKRQLLLIEKTDPRVIAYKLRTDMSVKKEYGRKESYYWGAHQRFFKSFLIAIKVPFVADAALRHLRCKSNPKCVVIGMQSTGDAATQRSLHRSGQVSDDEISTPDEIIRQTVRYCWPDAHDPDAPTAATALAQSKTLARQTAAAAASAAAAPSDAGAKELPKPPPQKKQKQKQPPRPPKERWECEHCFESNAPKRSECSGCKRPRFKRPKKRAAVPPAGAPRTSSSSGGSSSASSSSGASRPSSFVAAKNGGCLFKVAFEPEADAWKTDIDARVDALELPANPLDDIVRRLGGPRQVAELTGRSEALVAGRDGRFRLEKRSASARCSQSDVNMAEKNKFCDGRKRVAIISDAASTGISLHADRDFANQTRRVHFTLELPWSSDKAIQQMGRSHRSNQATAPHYVLPMTPVAGERRFAAAVAARIAALGALTQGDRRATAAAKGHGLGDFDVDNYYGAKALRKVYGAVEWMHFQTKRSAASGSAAAAKAAKYDIDVQGPRLGRTDIAALRAMGHAGEAAESFFVAAYYWLRTVGINVGEAASSRSSGTSKGPVGKFLNRIAGLKIYQQKLLFDYFSDTLDAVVVQAQREGTYETAVGDLQGRKIHFYKPPETIKCDLVPHGGGDDDDGDGCEASSAGGAGKLPKLTQYFVEVDNGVSFEDAGQIYEESQAERAKQKNRREAIARRADGDVDGDDDNDDVVLVSAPARAGSGSGAANASGAAAQPAAGALCRGKKSDGTPCRQKPSGAGSSGLSLYCRFHKDQAYGGWINPRADRTAGDMDGFWMCRRPAVGTDDFHYVVLAIEKEFVIRPTRSDNSRKMRIIRPHNQNCFSKSLGDLKRAYRRVAGASMHMIQSQWDSAFLNAAQFCPHGKRQNEGCKCHPSYYRNRRMRVLTGPILYVWDELTAFRLRNPNNHGSIKKNNGIKIVRVSEKRPDGQSKDDDDEDDAILNADAAGPRREVLGIRLDEEEASKMVKMLREAECTDNRNLASAFEDKRNPPTNKRKGAPKSEPGGASGGSGGAVVKGKGKENARPRKKTSVQMEYSRLTGASGHLAFSSSANQPQAAGDENHGGGANAATMAMMSSGPSPAEVQAARKAQAEDAARREEEKRERVRERQENLKRLGISVEDMEEAMGASDDSDSDLDDGSPFAQMNK